MRRGVAVLVLVLEGYHDISELRGEGGKIMTTLINLLRVGFRGEEIWEEEERIGRRGNQNPEKEKERGPSLVPARVKIAPA
jgi:hypothetical protein